MCKDSKVRMSWVCSRNDKVSILRAYWIGGVKRTKGSETSKDQIMMSFEGKTTIRKLDFLLFASKGMWKVSTEWCDLICSLESSLLWLCGDGCSGGRREVVSSFRRLELGDEEKDLFGHIAVQDNCLNSGTCDWDRKHQEFGWELRNSIWHLGHFKEAIRHVTSDLRGKVRLKIQIWGSSAYRWD